MGLQVVDAPGHSYPDQLDCAACIARDIRGWKTPVIHIMPLQRSMKTESTAMTTLKFVVLDHISLNSHQANVADITYN